MKDWKELAEEAKFKKTLKQKLSLLDTKVKVKGRGKWEEGTLVITSFDPEFYGKCEPEYFVMYAEDDLEQLIGLDNVKFYINGEWVEDSNDIPILFDLTDDEKEFLNLNDYETVVKSI
jgi:hypothetical protein